MNREARRAEKKRLGIRTYQDEVRNAFRITWTSTGRFAHDVGDAAMVRKCQEAYKFVRPHNPESNGLLPAYLAFSEWAQNALAEYQQAVEEDDAAEKH